MPVLGLAGAHFTPVCEQGALAAPYRRWAHITVSARAHTMWAARRWQLCQFIQAPTWLAHHCHRQLRGHIGRLAVRLQRAEAVLVVRDIHKVAAPAADKNRRCGLRFRAHLATSRLQATHLSAKAACSSRSWLLTMSLNALCAKKAVVLFTANFDE